MTRDYQYYRERCAELEKQRDYLAEELSKAIAAVGQINEVIAQTYPEERSVES